MIETEQKRDGAQHAMFSGIIRNQPCHQRLKGELCVSAPSASMVISTSVLIEIILLAMGRELSKILAGGLQHHLGACYRLERLRRPRAEEALHARPIEHGGEQQLRTLQVAPPGAKEDRLDMLRKPVDVLRCQLRHRLG